MAYNPAHDKYRALFRRDNGPLVGDWDIDYSYFSPVEHGADKEKKYPLVIFLAGALEGWAEGIEIAANEMPLWADEKYQSRFHNGGAYLLFGRAPEEDKLYWDQSCLVEPLRAAILDFLEKHPNADSSRVYLIGWCVGSLGVMNLASSYPELFASVVMMAPSRAINKSEAARLREMPVWIMSGLFDTHAIYQLYTMPTWSRLKTYALDARRLRLSTFRRAIDVNFVPQVPIVGNHNFWDWASEDLHFEGVDGHGVDHEYILTGTYRGIKTIDGADTPINDPYLIAWLNQYTNEGRTAIRDPKRNVRPSERWNSFFHETIGHNSRLLTFKCVIGIYRKLGWME